MTITVRILAVSMALAIVAGPVRAQQPYQQTDVQVVRSYRDASTYFEKAKDYFAKKDYEKAERQLDACLERMPDFADAHLLLAKVLYVRKDFPGALAHVERAEASCGALAGVRAYLEKERLAELRERRALLDDQVNTLQGRLAVTSTAGEQEALRSQIEQTESVREDIDRQLNAPLPAPSSIPAEYHFFHGNALLRLQRYDEAAAEYQRALQVDPKNADAANNLASLYYSAQRYDWALAVLERAESLGVTVNPELKNAVLAAARR